MFNESKRNIIKSHTINPHEEFNNDSKTYSNTFYFNGNNSMIKDTHSPHGISIQNYDNRPITPFKSKDPIKNYHSIRRMKRKNLQTLEQEENCKKVHS